MQKLLDGVRKFMSTAFAEERALFEELSSGQAPEVLLITCSDSRIDPSLVTQSKPGELFVLRNAGNIMPPHGAPAGGEAPTIEYAVAALGVGHIIVCGHSGCGAVTAALDASKTDDLPAVRKWLEYAESTRRIITDNFSELQGEERLMTAIEVNVLLQLSNLKTHPAVASALAAGTLELHAWVYHIASGTVLAFDANTGRFTSLSDGDERLTGVVLGKLASTA